MSRHEKLECSKCSRMIGNNNFSKHFEKCEGKKICPVCDKEFVGSGKTCGYACSNKFFRSGSNNGNWKEDRYQTTCFQHHERKCVVCDETKILDVHHVNEDHNDNRPENLIPLCPTHHRYYHSKYKEEVSPLIEEYLRSRNPSVA